MSIKLLLLLLEYVIFSHVGVYEDRALSETSQLMTRVVHPGPLKALPQSQYTHPRRDYEE